MKRFILKIEKGKPVFKSDVHRAMYHDWLKKLEGKYIWIGHEPTVRTNQQNRYYRAYLNIIEHETGNNADEMHEYFKRKFLEPKTIKVMGQEIKIPGTTTELSKIDFGDYMDKICSLTEIPLPNPEELEALGYISNTKRYH